MIMRHMYIGRHFSVLNAYFFHLPVSNMCCKPDFSRKSKIFPTTAPVVGVSRGIGYRRQKNYIE